MVYRILNLSNLNSVKMLENTYQLCQEAQAFLSDVHNLKKNIHFSS